MLKAPFGISAQSNAEAIHSSLELTPTSEIENTLKALFDRLTDEVAKHSEALFGKQISKTQLEQCFSSPLRKSEKGDLLRIKVADEFPVHELKEQTEAGLQVEDTKLSSIGRGTLVTGKIKISPVWHMKRLGELDQWGVSLQTARSKPTKRRRYVVPRIQFHLKRQTKQTPFSWANAKHVSVSCNQADYSVEPI